MRVALSLLTLDPRIAGGSETYVNGLCGALRRGGAHDYRALVSRLAPSAAQGLPSVVASVPASDTSASRLRAIVGAAIRPGALRAVLEEADVVHYPVTVPVPTSRRPRVVTLHDVQHRDLPRLFSPAKRAFRRLAYDRSARRADHVIVVSEWVRARAIAELGLASDRVHAIHLGVDHARFSPSAAVEREPFLLYPARAWPHKNHELLLAAHRSLRSSGHDLRLVLVGAGHRVDRADGVEVRGHVSEAELVDLYRRAAVLVFPSLYEGFGLPPLEAMACGCPVAAAAAGALPEVCGDAAVLFDPHDPEAIARGVLEALERRDELAVAGAAHAARFTWEATARAHDLVYELCA